MKTLLILILSLSLFSCCPQKLSSKFAVVTSIDDMRKFYVVTARLQDGRTLINQQPLVNFSAGDTVKVSTLMKNGWLEVKLRKID